MEKFIRVAVTVSSVYFSTIWIYASPDILQKWAHLGTDESAILPIFRNRLENGVEVHFNATVTKFINVEGRCEGVVLADGSQIQGAPVIVAAGHSARDTAEAMLAAGANADACSIAIGARIEHPQLLVDEGRYGTPERGALPPASYRLSHQTANDDKVHTFCMCPGGLVVPATNHESRVVVNGMSFSTRRAKWANSAVIVAIDPEDYGTSGPLAGYEWQDEIERACFSAAGSDYAAPAQRVSDFLKNTLSETLPKISYPLGVVSCRLDQLLPPPVVAGMKSAIRAWEKEIPGFSNEGVLIAPETRTTSPIRFRRTEDCESTGLPGLYPVGEGAGYGGGIVSCALDGLRAGRAIVAKARLLAQSLSGTIFIVATTKFNQRAQCSPGSRCNRCLERPFDCTAVGSSFR